MGTAQIHRFIIIHIWPNLDGISRFFFSVYWYISLTNTHLAWAALLLYKKHIELPPTPSFDAAIRSALCQSPGGRPPYLGDGLLFSCYNQAMAGGCYFVKIGENVGISKSRFLAEVQMRMCSNVSPTWSVAFASHWIFEA